MNIGGQVAERAKAVLAEAAVNLGYAVAEVDLHRWGQGPAAYAVDVVDEGLDQAAGLHVVRVGLELAPVLLRGRRFRGLGRQVQVRRGTEGEATVVHRLVVRTDAVAHEAIDAVGTAHACSVSELVADGEQVVL